MIYKQCDKQFELEIILLTFNNIDNTKECVKRIYDFTSDFKITILDNGSTDLSRDFLKDLSEKCKNISLFLSVENLGIVRGRNMAYKFSCMSANVPSYICFLDNDQFVEEGWKESYMKMLSKGFDIVGAEGWRMADNFYPEKKAKNCDDIFHYVGCGGMMMKREVRNVIGDFDERFNPYYFEDPDFCFRAMDKGMKIGWDDSGKVIHKPHNLLGVKMERYDRFKISFQKFQAKWSGRKLSALNEKL